MILIPSVKLFRIDRKKEEKRKTLRVFSVESATHSKMLFSSKIKIRKSAFITGGWYALDLYKDVKQVDQLFGQKSKVSVTDHLILDPKIEIFAKADTNDDVLIPKEYAKEFIANFENPDPQRSNLRRKILQKARESYNKHSQ